MVYTIMYKKNKHDRTYRPIQNNTFEVSDLIDIVKLAQAFKKQGNDKLKPPFHEVLVLDRKHKVLHLK